MKWNFDSIMLITIDQLTNMPIAKISCRDLGISISLKPDKTTQIEIYFNKINGYYYEETDDHRQLIEKTFLGGDLERQAILSHSFADKDLIEELVNVENKKVITEPINLSSKKDFQIKLNIDMTPTNRDFHLMLCNMKILVVLNIFLRLKDFFIYTIQPNMPKSKEIEGNLILLLTN